MENLKNKYERKINAAREKFSSEIEAITESVKREVVIPFCFKHQLSLICGMGTFVFKTHDGKLLHDNSIIDNHFKKTKAAQELKAIIEILELTGDHNHCSIGCFMGDYSPS